LLEPDLYKIALEIALQGMLNLEKRFKDLFNAEEPENAKGTQRKEKFNTSMLSMHKPQNFILNLSFSFVQLCKVPFIYISTPT
jgi:hypothetical protein